jgi:hypothetical protein
MLRPLFLSIIYLFVLNKSNGADLDGLLICGYQGWFRTPLDNTGLGWRHYTQGKQFAPGECSIDLWPDVTDLPESSKTPTSFIDSTGKNATVFSSVDKEVIKTHFDWLSRYGIDGIFLQRFILSTKDPQLLASMDKLLLQVIRESVRTERVWGLMYDLTGIRTNDVHLVNEDIDRLLANPEFSAALRSNNYLTRNHKPIIALWGLGFSDRQPMFKEWSKIIEYVKHPNSTLDCSVLLGVPTYWRSTSRDAVNSPELLKILEKADVIMPWTVGRYNNSNQAKEYAYNTLKNDILWCEQKGVLLLPVVFPGFSWHNLSKSRGIESPLNMISRNGGSFFWSQFKEFHKVGAESFFVAMFDELDEGTAIFKINNNPPCGNSSFIFEKGVPTDQYLKLTGMAAKYLKGRDFPEWAHLLPGS